MHCCVYTDIMCGVAELQRLKISSEKYRRSAKLCHEPEAKRTIVALELANPTTVLPSFVPS